MIPVGEKYRHYKGAVVEFVGEFCSKNNHNDGFFIVTEDFQATYPLACCDIEKGDHCYLYRHDDAWYIRTARNFTEIIAYDGWVGHRFERVKDAKY